MKDEYIFNGFYKNRLCRLKLGDNIYAKYFGNLFNEELKYILGNENIINIADLGCGDGQFEDFLIDGLGLNIENKQFYCFDGSAVAINKAKMRNLGKSIFFHEDILKLHNKYSDFFDAIVIVNVIHHLNDFEIIREAYKILKHGGKLIIIDIPWDNPIVKMEFKIFDILPISLKNKLAYDDLFIDGERPDRFYFNKNQLNCALDDKYFKIINKDYSHLFLFLFFHFEKMFILLGVPKKIIRFAFYPFFLLNYHFENFLLRFVFFQNLSAIYRVIAIKCEK